MGNKIKEMAKVLPDMIIDKTWRPEKVARELYEIAVPNDCVVISKEEYLKLQANTTSLEQIVRLLEVKDEKSTK